MSALYHLPAEKFQHITPAGRPSDIAEFLQPYLDAGARTITLVPVAADLDTAIDLCGEVRRLLVPDPVLA